MGTPEWLDKKYAAEEKALLLLQGNFRPRLRKPMRRLTLPLLPRQRPRCSTKTSSSAFSAKTAPARFRTLRTAPVRPKAPLSETASVISSACSLARELGIEKGSLNFDEALSQLGGSEPSLIDDKTSHSYFGESELSKSAPRIGAPLVPT